MAYLSLYNYYIILFLTVNITAYYCTAKTVIVNSTNKKKNSSNNVNSNKKEGEEKKFLNLTKINVKLKLNFTLNNNTHSLKLF